MLHGPADGNETRPQRKSGGAGGGVGGCRCGGCAVVPFDLQQMAKEDVNSWALFTLQQILFVTQIAS